MSKNNIIILLLIIVAGFLASSPAFAATMLLSSPSANYSTGSTINVDVLLNTKNVSVNTAEATIKFPADLLEVVSVSKTNSIFSLWVQDPSFSNSAGTISFGGGVPNPGFTGSAGKIISITFHAKKSGTASLVFPFASILANDGLGTDITEAPGLINILVSDALSVGNQTIKATTPSIVAPTISSSTHQNSETWYNANDARFSWINPKGTTGVSIYLTRKANSIPLNVPDGLFSDYDYKELEDGVWYFHARLTNGSVWSSAAHFQFNIDTKKPESLEVNEINGDDKTNSKVQFKFLAQDSGSGISNYLVSLDGNRDQFWSDSGDHVYEVPAVSMGKHQLSVKAFDKAGNYITTMAEFMVEEPILGADTTTGTIENNVTPVVSNPSESDYFLSTRAFVNSVGPDAISMLSILVPLLAMIIVLIFIIYYGLSQWKVFREQLKREFDSVEKGLYKILSELNVDIKEHINIIEKAGMERHLTSEEKKIVKVFRKNLDKLERFKMIKKEIKRLNKIK